MRIDDYRLHLGADQYIPIMIGGMGVAISTRELALEAARLGGIGHISDAMAPAVVDTECRTAFVRNKFRRCRSSVGKHDKSKVEFDLGEVAEATRRHVSSTMDRKRGPGGIFINCMEKLTMGNPAATLKARLEAAMDAGIDGITLSAGLHLGSLALVAEHPRLHDVKLGIIVSSRRALEVFLKRARRVGRMPDYVVVEGPLAGGHLGFGGDWAEHSLHAIVDDVLEFLREHELAIPVIAAGGVFSGTDGVLLMEAGCGAVQVATRFTITEECGLPAAVKQRYLRAVPDDIVVNDVSPTGYPMRMLRDSPAIGASTPPNCEAYGYLLDRDGRCSYLDAWEQARTETGDRKPKVMEKTCLCTQMRRFKVWTCGQHTWRLKETAVRSEDGSYALPSAEHVFLDYQYSTDHRVHPPMRGEPGRVGPNSAARASAV